MGGLRHRPSREVFLREYFDTMILKDIVQRFNIGKPQQCIELYHIITCGQERRFNENGVVVRALPAWQWMLQDNRFTD